MSEQMPQIWSRTAPVTHLKFTDMTWCWHDEMWEWHLVTVISTFSQSGSRCNPSQMDYLRLM